MGILRKLSSPVFVILRMQRITYVFYRYGIAQNLASIGIVLGKRGFALVLAKPQQPLNLDATLGKNLAQALVELGPTFIKLGQGLALRPEMVGPVVAQELRVLFDRVPPIPFRRIEKILKSELGSERYKREIKKVERVALASASLSQIHRAELKDGRDVILKVLKPGASDLVKLDLEIVQGLVKLIDILGSRWNLKVAFEDFKQATLREIDYRAEAKNIDQFSKNNKRLFSSTCVTFPRYYSELSTSKVLTLEPMLGKKATELKPNSMDAKRMARMGLEAILEQIFDYGFFHADPHAGNLFFLQDTGKIGFIDLGLVGTLDPKDKQAFLKVMLAIVKRDKSELSQSLYALGTPSKNSNYESFKIEIESLIDNYSSQKVRKIQIQKVIESLFEIAKQHEIYIPNRYVLMIRSCLMIEGVAKHLDPSISLFNIAAPVLTRSLIKSYNPFRIFKK